MRLRCRIARRIARSVTLLAVLFAVWVAGEGEAVADLAASLRAAENSLKGAEGDLAAAAGSAGTAGNPATGSRLKLTRLRLDSAIGRLNQAAAILSEVPAEAAGVGALLARHASAVTSAQKIEAILASGSPPPSGGGTAHPPNEGGGMRPPTTDPTAAKLDYKQEKLLKDAQFNLREVDKYAGAAMAVMSRLDGEGEPAVHSDVRAALGHLERAEEKHRYAEANLAALPGDHPDVMSAAGEAAAQKETLGALRSRLEAADAELEKLTGLSNYPRFDEDFGRLQDFARRYGDFRMLAEEPGKLAAILREDAAVMGEVQRVARVYLPLVEQKTEAGAKMERMFNHFVGKRDAFAKDLAVYREGLPAAIDADLLEADRIADAAVTQKNPRYFGGGSGIEQRMGWAEGKVVVLEALDAEKGAEYRTRLAEAVARMEARAESLTEEIIANNNLPPNLYQGADRADLVAKATAAWVESQPGAKVLSSRIPSADWKRVSEWRWSRDHFYKVDYSRIQVQLIVEHDARLAAIRAVNLTKDHLEGDRIQASALDSPTDRLRPQQLLLKDRVR